MFGLLYNINIEKICVMDWIFGVEFKVVLGLFWVEFDIKINLLIVWFGDLYVGRF